MMNFTCVYVCVSVCVLPECVFVFVYDCMSRDVFVSVYMYICLCGSLCISVFLCVMYMLMYECYKSEFIFICMYIFIAL